MCSARPPVDVTASTGRHGVHGTYTFFASGIYGTSAQSGKSPPSSISHQSSYINPDILRIQCWYGYIGVQYACLYFINTQIRFAYRLSPNRLFVPRNRLFPNSLVSVLIFHQVLFVQWVIFHPRVFLPIVFKFSLNGLFLSVNRSPAGIVAQPQSSAHRAYYSWLSEWMTSTIKLVTARRQSVELRGRKMFRISQQLLNHIFIVLKQNSFPVTSILWWSRFRDSSEVRIDQLQKKLLVTGRNQRKFND